MRKQIGRSSKRCARTGKVRFRDEASAVRVVRHAQRDAGDGERVPGRVYECEFCGGWHVTSQELDPARKRAGGRGGRGRRDPR